MPGIDPAVREELCIPVPEYSSDSDGDTDEPPPRVNAAAPEAAASLPPPAPSRPQPRLPEQALSADADPSYLVERVHFSELCVADFRRRVLVTRTPIIVTGLAPFIAPGGFSEATLRHLLPEGLALPVRGQGVMAASEFFRRIDAEETVYVADVPVAHHCPVTKRCACQKQTACQHAP